MESGGETAKEGDKIEAVSTSTPLPQSGTHPRQSAPAESGTVNGQTGAPVEVYIGGLPSDLKDEELTAVLAAIGPVVELRVHRNLDGLCRGFAYVKFPERSMGEKCCQQIRSLRGAIPLGCHITRSRRAEDISDEEVTRYKIRPASDTTSITTILKVLRESQDRKAAAAAAVKAFKDSVDGAEIGKQMEDEYDPEKAEIREQAVLQPDMNNYLDMFPKCRELMVKIRSTPNNDNKTPCGVLNEYANRLCLTLQYSDAENSSLGPFTIESTLTGDDGTVYASGTGRASKKKDAKQMAASAALEVLLENVSEQDFMLPGKNKMGGGRGRGGNRWNNGSRGGYGHRQGNHAQPSMSGMGPGKQASGSKRNFAAMLAGGGPVNQSPSPAILGEGGMVQGPQGPINANQAIGPSDGMMTATMNPTVDTMGTWGAAMAAAMGHHFMPMTGMAPTMDGNQHPLYSTNYRGFTPPTTLPTNMNQGPSQMPAVPNPMYMGVGMNAVMPPQVGPQGPVMNVDVEGHWVNGGQPGQYAMPPGQF